MQATATGDQQMVRTMMKGYFQPNGSTDYLQLLRVPTNERIPALVKTDKLLVHKIVATQIEFAFKYFNLKNPMTAEQIYLLSAEILTESEQDNLSIQDIYSFLIKLLF